LAAGLAVAPGDGLSDMPGFVRVSDATVAVDEAGEGAAVLLLHGFPVTRHLWSRVGPSLASAGYHVLMPDLVGYGASRADAGVAVDMARQAQWMFELLDALSLPRAVVVAHDVGSAAAQLMLVNAPERVRGLVVLDGVYGGEWAMDAIRSIQNWNPTEAHRLAAVLTRRLGKTPGLRELVAAYDGEQGGLRLIRAAGDLDPRQTAHIADALRAQRVPALVLWGEHDEFFPVATVARPLAELLGARLVVLAGGHFTPLDCAADVAAALIDFLTHLQPESQSSTAA
jgi:pimeloyl-ACP methyl ester carboxylesterase